MADDYRKIQREIFTSKFSSFCKKTFRKDMAELEKVRHKYISAVYVIAAVFAIIFVIYLYFCYVSELAINYEIPTILISLGLIIGAIPITCYKDKAKKLIMPKLLSFIGDFKLQEKYSQDMMLRAYVESLKLFHDFNCFSSDDILTGTYKGINVSIAEIDLKKITGSGKNRRVHTIFDGILVKFKSFKKFQGETIIRCNGINIINNSSKVNLEDPEFEKIYDVYSLDQIEARYLITPAFMKRLVELNKKGIGRNITLSFEQGNVNIAVHSSKNWFEVPLLKPATEISNYRAILLDLISILSIIDVLKLDQNIGM